MFVDREQCVAFWQTWTVVYFADPGLATTFLQAQSGSAGMRNDVATNRLLGIWIEHSAGSAIDLSNDLVCNDHSDAELISQTLKHSHEASHVGLSRGQFPSAVVVCSVEGCGGINYQ